MREVAVRDLRNYGGQFLDRVEAGEAALVARDGKAVAQLTPLPKPRLNSTALLERWRNAPAVSLDTLRNDITKANVSVLRSNSRVNSRAIVLQGSTDA
jgi:antitoxin (DNA-binding transcriptional repressor) of toxin-antitoxin stability system